MYFDSSEHKQRFDELMGNLHSVEAKALIYLATSSILNDLKLIERKDGKLMVRNVKTSVLSSSQAKLTKLAYHLYDSSKKADSFVSMIDCLDDTNRRVLIQALSIRARV